MSKDTFITGKGLNMVNALSKKLDKEQKHRMRHLHCEPLHFIVEIGFVGVMLAIWCIWSVLRLPVSSNLAWILKSVFIGFTFQSLSLFPAHLWMMSTTWMFCYAGLYLLKEEIWQ